MRIMLYIYIYSIYTYIYIYLYPIGTLSCETVQNSAKSCGCLFGDCFGILPWWITMKKTPFGRICLELSKHRRCKSKKGKRSVFWYHLKLTQWKNPPGNTQHIPPKGNLGKSSTQKHGYGWGYVIVCRRGHVTVTWGKFALWRGWASSIFLGGGNWNMFKFHPNLGKWSNLTCAYFSDGLVKNHHLVQSYTKNLWKRSHMDPNRESKHPSTDHFRWDERYHDLLSLFEFLDNGAAWLWKTRKLRICFKSWRVGEPLGMFRCMSTTEDTHGTQKNGGLVQMMFRISIGWFFGSKC